MKRLLLSIAALALAAVATAAPVAAKAHATPITTLSDDDHCHGC